MGSYKSLIKNIGMLTLGMLSTKILAFLLVPFYTNILTTEEYGTYELINTILNLLLPIITLNIAEGVLRFSVESDFKERKIIFSIGVKYTFAGVVIEFLLLFLNEVFLKNNFISKNAGFLFVLFVLQAFHQLFVFFARGMEDISGVTLGGVISTLVVIILNILFLGIFHFGLWGYLMSTVVAYIVICVFYAVRLKIWKYFSFLTKDNDELNKKVIHYCTPLIFNSIGWWVNNASDRFVVTWLCGIRQNGIYSVAYKIPAILTAFQNVFNQAWILSSVQEFDSDDKNGFFKNIYAYTNCTCSIVCFLLIAFSKQIAGFMFNKDFYTGWMYAPLLTAAVIFGTLSGVFGGIYNTANKPKIVGFSTCIGAVTNIILNIVLVHIWGPIGAAIATVVSGIIVWMIRLVRIKEIIDIKIRLHRDVTVYAVLFVQMILLFAIDNKVIYFLLSMMVFIVLTILFSKELACIIRKIAARRIK